MAVIILAVILKVFLDTNIAIIIASIAIVPLYKFNQRACECGGFNKFKALCL